MAEESTMKEQRASHTYKRQAPLGAFPVAQKRKGEQESQLALEKDHLADRLSEASSERSVGGLYSKERRTALAYGKMKKQINL